MGSYRISQVAERTGVPATTLRFYEQAGLLPAARTAAGYRVYDDAAVERLSFIRAAKDLGLPLEEISDLLAVWQDGACSDVRDTLRPLVAARIDDAQTRLAELAAFTSRLSAALVRLDELPARPGPCGPDCGFISAVDAESWREAPIACSLSKVDQGQRAEQWRDLLADAPREPVTEGIRFTLPAELAAPVAGLAVAEQLCCPFFDFQLRLAGDRLHFQVRAPAHAAELLTELFGPRP